MYTPQCSHQPRLAPLSLPPARSGNKAKCLELRDKALLRAFRIQAGFTTGLSKHACQPFLCVLAPFFIFRNSWTNHDRLLHRLPNFLHNRQRRSSGSVVALMRKYGTQKRGQILLIRWHRCWGHNHWRGAAARRWHGFAVLSRA